MKAKLGLTVDTLISRLEYKFVPGRWTIPQMIEVGLTMPVVMQHGMQTTDEWAELKATARNTSDLLQFGFTPLLESQLVHPMAHEPTATPPPTPSTGMSPSNAPIYGPIIPKQWPPPGIAVPVVASSLPSSARVANYSWGSKLPPDVMAQPTAPVHQMVAPRVDTTPKLVDRPTLLLLPQHQTNQTVKYALK